MTSSPTEITGYDYKQIGKETTAADAVKVFPFSSARKRAGVIFPRKDKPGSYRVYMKGASEIILSLCSTRLDPETNEETAFGADDKRGIENVRRVTPRLLYFGADFLSALNFPRGTMAENCSSMHAQI